jgi:single-stranded DNA-binding protein
MVVDLSHNNVVQIYGKIFSRPEFSHEVFGEKFYEFIIEVNRLSEISDKVRATVSERLIDINKLKVGCNVFVHGQFRSYNNYSERGNRLILTVFVREIEFDIDLRQFKNPNQIFLDGFICKKPQYRTTPFGREITDILLAVNRSYNKSDYIPCIAWGRNAKYSGMFNIGTKVLIEGRIQSREYIKNLGEVEISKTAYEISANRIELIDE